MKKWKLLIGLICLVFVGCFPAFVPIVKVDGYYRPTQSAQLVNEIPEDAIYIGTIKLVPHDLAGFRSRNIDKVYYLLQHESAKVGARYIYVTNLTRRPIDYIWEYLDSGYTIQAELYR